MPTLAALAGYLFAAFLGETREAALRAVTLAIWSLPSFWLGLLILMAFAFVLLAVSVRRFSKTLD